MDTDRHVTWFLWGTHSVGVPLKGWGKETRPGMHTIPVGNSPPVPSENLPSLLLRLEAPLALPGLWDQEPQDGQGAMWRAGPCEGWGLVRGVAS